jgi:hypothetical protein
LTCKKSREQGLARRSNLIGKDLLAHFEHENASSIVLSPMRTIIVNIRIRRGLAKHAPQMAGQEVANQDQNFELEFNTHGQHSSAFALSGCIATVLPVQWPVWKIAMSLIEEDNILTLCNRRWHHGKDLPAVRHQLAE